MLEDKINNPLKLSKMRAAIHQPHYFPWIPYWNKIASVDVFIIFDTVQLPRGKSRVLRAKYLDSNGEKWLTIPFGQKGELLPIKDIRLENSIWKKEHINKIKNAYRKAPYADFANSLVAECLNAERSGFLLDLELKIIEKISGILGIKTQLILASDVAHYRDLSLQEYIVTLLEGVQAGVYLSGNGEGSRKTIAESIFKEKRIEIEYQNYLVPPYQHLNGNEFVPTVSILDALFMLGPAAIQHITPINPGSE